MMGAPGRSSTTRSSARRRDAYRRRPCHEQATWFARIGGEADFEAVELACMLADAVSSRTPLRRQWARVTARLRRSLGYERGVLNRNREFKGLDPLRSQPGRPTGAGRRRAYLIAPAVRPET